MCAIAVWYRVYDGLSMMRTEVWGIAIATRLFHVDPFSILAFEWWWRFQQLINQFHLAYTLYQSCPLSLCPADWINITPCDIVARRSTRRFSRKQKTRNSYHMTMSSCVTMWTIDAMYYIPRRYETKYIFTSASIHMLYVAWAAGSSRTSYTLHGGVQLQYKELWNVCPTMTA